MTARLKAWKEARGSEKDGLAAVCLSIDDVHPSSSSHFYEAGGDLGRGALGHLQWLLDRHPLLKATLFVTADWREISPRPTRRLLASIPRLRDKVYLAKRWPEGTMRLDLHPGFVAYIRSLPRTEVALHGLYHCHKGLNIPVEFQEQPYSEFRKILDKSIAIFARAGIDFIPGICPPGWNAPPALRDAMVDVGLLFVGSARDINTPIARDAVTNMSGMKGVSLLFPQAIHNRKILHIPCNFSATSPVDRAIEIIENGGLLSIKAHIIKVALGHMAEDGLDKAYRNYLDVLFSMLEDRYGDRLIWTSMGELAHLLKEELDR